MIFIDSGIWIDFYNGVESQRVDRLRSAIRSDDVIVGDLVIAEVLQGYRDDIRAAKVARDLFAFDVRAVSDARIAMASAAHYRALRIRGITVRKTIDSLIATRCIVEGWTLLYSDRDFDPFVEHLGLRSAIG